MGKAAIVKELARRVQAGDSLAMDYASRMQRAREQGFDTDTVYYHGTNADFDAFDLGKANTNTENELASLGAWVTDDPRVAAQFAYDEAGNVREGANIKPVFLRKGQEKIYAADGIDTAKAEDELAKKQDQIRVKKIILKDQLEANRLDPIKSQQIQNQINALDFESDKLFKQSDRLKLKDPLQQVMNERDEFAIYSGYKKGEGNWSDRKLNLNPKEASGELRNKYQEQGIDTINLIDTKYDRVGDSSNQLIALDPSNIRSVNAAFDPAKKDSSNLLASIGAGTVVGAGALGASDTRANTIRSAENAFGKIAPDALNPALFGGLESARTDPRGKIAAYIRDAMREGQERSEGNPVLELAYPFGSGMQQFFDNLAYGRKNRPMDYVNATLEVL